MKKTNAKGYKQFLPPLTRELLQARPSGETITEIFAWVHARYPLATVQEVMEAMLLSGDDDVCVIYEGGSVRYTLVRNYPAFEYYITEAIIGDNAPRAYCVARARTLAEAYALAGMDYLGRFPRFRSVKVVRNPDKRAIHPALLHFSIPRAVPAPPKPEINERAEEYKAIAAAVLDSISDKQYDRLKFDAADDVVRLAFAVEVDSPQHQVRAKYSGSIMLAEIPDPAQGEFDFEKGGEA